MRVPSNKSINKEKGGEGRILVPPKKKTKVRKSKPMRGRDLKDGRGKKDYGLASSSGKQREGGSKLGQREGKKSNERVDCSPLLKVENVLHHGKVNPKKRKFRDLRKKPLRVNRRRCTGCAHSPETSRSWRSAGQRTKMDRHRSGGKTEKTSWREISHPKTSQREEANFSLGPTKRITKNKTPRCSDGAAILLKQALWNLKGTCEELHELSNEIQASAYFLHVGDFDEKIGRRGDARKLFENR